MDATIARLLRWAVVGRKNIAVSGGTGSGKTTLLNALSVEIPSSERIITIEDAAELRFSTHPHVVRLEARMKNIEGSGEISIRELVVNALRMRPDRIVVGECRGAEALDMLQAMNTGHDGSLTTLHANSPIDVISRLVMMTRYGMDLPVEIIEEQIGSALDLIVQIDRFADGARRVTQLCSCSSTRGAIELVPLVIWDMATRTYAWQALPPWLATLAHVPTIDESEVEAWRSSLLLP
jgi:pilus assembly protein CpaF